MLTSEQHDHYRRHGWIIVDKLMSDERIAELRLALDDVIEERAAAPRVRKEMIYGDTKINVIQQAYRAHPAFAEHIYHPKITAIASQLMNDSVVRLWHDQAILKRPREGGGISWHQDAGHWQHVTPMDMTTCWLALDDVDKENGCMMMLDGSHQWGLQKVDVLFAGSDLETALRQLPDKQRNEAKMVPMKMRAGQASFHHPYAFHGSYENRSSRPRRCVILHFLNGHNRYIDANDPVGKGKGHEVTVNDGEIICGANFPVVYDHGPMREQEEKQLLL